MPTIRKRAPAEAAAPNAVSRVRTIRRDTERADTSRQVEEPDVFMGSPLQNHVVSTPYSMQALDRSYNQSNTLPPCIESMVTNIAMFGFRVVPAIDGGTMDPAEEKVLKSFIETANTEESLMTVHAKKIFDYEKYGFGFIEVIRDASGKLTLLRHARSFITRLLSKSGDPHPVKVTITRGGKRNTIMERKRFRKYVQILGATTVYFKEFGDTRKMDCRTGEYRDDVEPEYLATELLHERQMSEDAYGTPRWASQTPSVIGSRESEECNIRYFQDNTIPPIMVLVSGGRLTKASFTQLQQQLSQSGKGRETQNRAVLIEAIPEVVGLEDKGTVSMEVVKLADARPSDGLFSGYDMDNRNKVRGSFRIGPAIIGMSGDTNFANVNAAAYLAETQVFQPERAKHDEFLNKMLVQHPQGLNLKTVWLESVGPRVTNPEQIVKIMTALNVMGGVTPRKAIDVINQTMQLSIEQYPVKGAAGYEEWMDMPIAISQRLYASKTQQTGEGDTTHAGQATKDEKIKEVEDTGATGPETLNVEHGTE